MKLMLERDSSSGKKRGGRAGKTKATWKGEPTNSLKRKHRLKECKCFARVGWILDYGLQFREEKRWAGGKKTRTNSYGENNFDEEELRIDLPKDKDGRIILTRNVPDKRGWTTNKN